MPDTPKSYDEIVRRTVPDPDTSWRPSTEQQERSAAGIREQSEAEHELRGRIEQALATAQIDTSRLTIEIDREHVTIRGEVRRASEMMQIENVIARVRGVETISDQLVVA